MWQAIIPAIASIAGAGISAASSIAGTRERNEAQKRESELAYRREQANIRMQNSYNSASAQMARLQAAGLNPNLMYENSQEAAAGTQTDIAHYQPAEVQNAFVPMGNAGQQMIESMVGLVDMVNKTKETQSRILLNASTADFNAANAEFTRSQNNRLLSLLSWDVKNAQRQYELSGAEIDKLKQQKKNLEADYDLICAKTGLTEEQAKNLDANTRYMLARLPYAAEFAQLEVAEKRKVIEKLAVEMAYMDESLKIQNFNKWVNLGDVIARNVVQAAGVAGRFLGKGASLQELYGADPWSMMKGKGAFTQGFDLNDSANPFGQFLAGD